MKRAEVAATEYEAGQTMDTVLQNVNNRQPRRASTNNHFRTPKIAMTKVIIVKSRA